MIKSERGGKDGNRGRFNGGEKTDEIPDHGVTFSGLERKLLVVHGLGIKLGERVGRTAKGGVHGPIYLVEAGSDGFPLLGHGGGD